MAANGLTGDFLDDHALWGESNVGVDDAKMIVTSYIKIATELAPGSVPGHAMELVKDTKKATVRWNEILRRFVACQLHRRRPTYARKNRRFPNWGFPGTTRRSFPRVNVILDTSGSISSEMLEVFFAEIEVIGRYTKTNVLQFDCTCHGYQPYRPGDWRHFQVHGRGGTDMAAAVDWLVANRRVAELQVMLTDGVTEWPRKRPFPMLFLITSAKGRVAEPSWGKVVYMNIGR